MSNIRVDLDVDFDVMFMELIKEFFWVGEVFGIEDKIGLGYVVYLEVVEVED